MMLQMYELYVSLKQQRKKQEAEEALQEFLASFQSRDEKAKWVHDYLSNREGGQKMPYPIYVHIVFPILLEGYQKKDAWSTLWLAKTVQNIYGIDALHEAIGRKSEFQLSKEAYILEPSPEARHSILKAEIRWFDYCQHEWPSGILYGHDGATLEECEDILREVSFANSLDETAEFKAFLTDFEQKVRKYQGALSARGGL